MKMKNSFITVLALLLVFSSVTVFGEKGVDVMPISIEIEGLPTYLEFKGEIKNINSSEGKMSILAENTLEGSTNGLVAHIFEDVLILSEENIDILKKEDLKEGMEVSIYYEKNTPMAMSLPPQLTPAVIIVRSEKNSHNIKIDTFNEELVSKDNWLKLNISTDSKLMDLKGNKLTEEDLKNKDLVVFFGATTRSIPAQTNPLGVIAIKNREVTVMDSLNISGKKHSLENKMIKEETLMIPLREVAEGLGFEVKWVDETKSVEFKKDDQTAKLTIGDNKYGYYDMEVELDYSPKLIDSKTYVPVDFMNQILIARFNITMDGLLELSK